MSADREPANGLRVDLIIMTELRTYINQIV